MNTSRVLQVNRLLFYILCAFPLLLPHWVSLLTILMLASALAYVILTRQGSFNWKFFLPVAGILLPFLFRLQGSEQFNAGMNTIQVRLMLVALPLAFSFRTLRLKEQEQHRAFTLFCYASAVLVIGSNLIMAIKGFTHPVGFQGADLTYSYRVSLEYYSNLHPTYYCAIVYMAAFVQIYHLLKQTPNGTRDKLLSLLTITICTLGGIAAASRATFIAYLIIVFLVLVLHYRNHPKRWLFLGVMVVGCIGMFFTPMVQNRLQEMTAKNMQAPEGHNDNGTNVRSGVFACDLQLLKEHWLWGVGTGNIQPALNGCLSQYNTHVYKEFNYNTHNEYLNMWITTGLFGFVVWLGCLLYPLVKSIRHKHWIHAYFLLFMGICFVTENYLDRQMGVTFFAMMQTLFFFKTFKEE
jgi:O-antigen ligase